MASERIAQLACEKVASDGTRKLLLRLRDGAEVEAVLIPPLDDDRNARRAANTRARTTLCVSSQRYRRSKGHGRQSRMPSSTAFNGWPISSDHVLG